MAYVLPQFPLTVNIWRNGNATSNPPDVVTTCNLSPGRRTMVAGLQAVAGLAAGPVLFMEILLPNLADIRGWNDAGGKDTVEVPAGTGRFYECWFVDDIAKGFANVHRFAILVQLTPWPSPVP